MRAMLLSTVARSFMSDTCETVIITPKGGGDPVRVNKSDYDADNTIGTLRKTDTKEQEAPTTAASPAPVDTSVMPPPTASAVVPTHATIPSPGDVGVVQDKKKFYLARTSDGTRLTAAEGAIEDGYATDKAAWDAVLGLPH